jgi:phosphoribosylformylglycinamidine synthase
MGAVIDYATSGRPVMGICNGFQILTEAHLLPGALIRNRDLKFICEDVPLYVEDSICKWVPPDTRRGIGDGAVPAIIHVPINHNEGNYYCDDETLRKLKANKQVVLRYAGANGAPNGALDDIAGICNEAGNVFGLMPHPERVVDGLAGYDGRMLFSGIVAGMVKEATA